MLSLVCRFSCDTEVCQTLFDSACPLLTSQPQDLVLSNPDASNPHATTQHPVTDMVQANVGGYAHNMLVLTSCQNHPLRPWQHGLPYLCLQHLAVQQQGQHLFWMPWSAGISGWSSQTRSPTGTLQMLIMMGRGKNVIVERYVSQETDQARALASAQTVSYDLQGQQ